MSETESTALIPSTEATQAVLEPIQLGHDDWLVIWMEDEGHFGLQAIRGKLVTNEERDRYYSNVPDLVPVQEFHLISKSSTGSYGANVLFDRIPECDLIKNKERPWEKKYRVGATDNSVAVISALWPRGRIAFRGEESRLTFEFILRRFRAQQARAVLQARFKLLKELPPLPRDFDSHPDLPLSDYQQVALQMGVGQEATGLFMDKGTGKTAISIARICLEAKRTRAGLMGSDPHMMRVLIVCPNQARINWIREFERFAVIGCKIARFKGGKFSRIKVLTHAVKSEDDCAFSAVISGFDTAAREIEMLKRIPWDLVVIDESHYMKSKGTKRFKTLIQLRELSRRRMILTGTPIGNTVFDLWTQLEFLGQGLSGFAAHKKFKEYHGQYKSGPKGASGTSVERLIGYRNIPFLQERLARLTFSITKAEAGICLDTPKVPEWAEVSMTPNQRSIYIQVAEQLAAEFEEKLDGLEESTTKQLTTNHILTKLLRLAQITSGHVKWDPVYDPETGAIVKPGYVEQIPGGNPKLDYVEQFFLDPERDPNEKTLIWCAFVEDIKRIEERLQKIGVGCRTYFGKDSQSERDQNYTDFNYDPSIKALICNAQTAGEALNLLGYDWDQPESKLATFTGSEIFFSANWSFLQRSQAEDRAHRRGTRMPVRIIDLCVPGTIDEEIRLRVQKKGETAMTVQDLREILSGILSEEISEGDDPQEREESDVSSEEE